MREPLYLDKIALVSTWVRIGLTPLITQIYKNSLTLRYPPNTNRLIGIPILTPMGRFFDTMIDVDC